MSYNALANISQAPTIDAISKAVLAAIARHADTRGKAWPSVARIMRMTSLCRRTIFNALNRLEAAGLLTRHRRKRPDGGWTSNIYMIARKLLLKPVATKSLRRGPNTPNVGRCTPPSASDAHQELIKKEENMLFSRKEYGIRSNATRSIGDVLKKALNQTT